MRPQAVMARADYLRDGPNFPIEQKRLDRAVFASVSRFLGQVSLLNDGKVQEGLLFGINRTVSVGNFSCYKLCCYVTFWWWPGRGVGYPGEWVIFLL